jgi:hypothetical protein
MKTETRVVDRIARSRRPSPSWRKSRRAARKRACRIAGA